MRVCALGGSGAQLAAARAGDGALIPRRTLWEKFAERAVVAPNSAPTESDFAALLSQDAAAQTGSVILVGAGPGDPELLTLRAVRALQLADVILFDHLVSPEILDFARREAKKMLVGKTGHAPSCKQDDINALMVSLAEAGRRVVRLKGGDPMIFGRADEEIAACRAAGIDVEVVPGITTAQAAAGRLKVSLTRRGEARRVQYITGRGRDGELPNDIDWKSLADPAATTVVYMPVRTLPALVAQSCAAGLDPATPSVAVAYATRAEERTIAGSIADLPALLAAEAPSGPVIVMIGRVFADYVQEVDLVDDFENIVITKGFVLAAADLTVRRLNPNAKPPKPGGAHRLEKLRLTSDVHNTRSSTNRQIVLECHSQSQEHVRD